MSTTILPIFVALIGLAGALIGAAAGLAGNQLALRQQTARAERNFRREVYSSFLEAVRTGHSEVQRHDAIRGAHDSNQLVVALKAGIYDAASWTASAEKLDTVATQGP